jgi:hypothetical protein
VRAPRPERPEPESTWRHRLFSRDSTVHDSRISGQPETPAPRPNHLLQSDRARDRRASLADRAFSLQVLWLVVLHCIGVPIPSMSCTALSVCPFAKDTRSPVSTGQLQASDAAAIPGARYAPVLGTVLWPVGMDRDSSFPQERCVYRPCL